jgi:hypothetical protein
MASGSGMIAAAVSVMELPTGKKKVIIPDHKLFIIPCSSQDEADFVAGFLNSDIARFIVGSYALATGISTHILERVPLPRFNPRLKDHTDLALASAVLRTRGVSRQTKPVYQKICDLSMKIASKNPQPA